MSQTIEQIMGEPPSSLEEAIERCLALLDENLPASLAWDEDKFIASLHHGLGQHMRNFWGLWSQDSGVYEDVNKRYQLTHADDISGIILHGAWRKRNNQPMNLIEIAFSYHRHWKEHGA